MREPLGGYVRRNRISQRLYIVDRTCGGHQCSMAKGEFIDQSYLRESCPRFRNTSDKTDRVRLCIQLSVESFEDWLRCRCIVLLQDCAQDEVHACEME